jgi:hypothetical protein
MAEIVQIQNREELKRKQILETNFALLQEIEEYKSKL